MSNNNKLARSEASIKCIESARSDIVKNTRLENNTAILLDMMHQIADDNMINPIAYEDDVLQRFEEDFAKHGEYLTRWEKKAFLTADELSEFVEHSKKNIWKARSCRPSDYIRRVFSKWLGKGLSRTDIELVQPKLMSAYSVEIHRHPERRISELIVRAQKRGVDAPKSLYYRPVADLTEEERKERRAADAARKRLQRQKRRKKLESLQNTPL